VKKVVYDKMIVYNTTKESTAPWLAQKENANRHVAPNIYYSSRRYASQSPWTLWYICPVKICCRMDGWDII